MAVLGTTEWVRENLDGREGVLANIALPLDQIAQTLDAIASSTPTAWTQEAP